MKKGNGYANVLFESNHTDAFNGKACGVTVVRSAHLPGSEKLAEKMIDAIVKVMKPSTGITYNRGVVTKTQSNGQTGMGLSAGQYLEQLHRDRRKMARFVMITLLSMAFMIIPRNVFFCRNRRI